MGEMSKFEKITAKIDRLLHHKSMLEERDRVIEERDHQLEDLMTLKRQAEEERDAERSRADDLQAEKDLIFEKLADVELEEMVEATDDEGEDEVVEEEVVVEEAEDDA